ncbi:MAG TPA: hypothetical protein ENH59_07700 [Bacteroidetes bacterium]|nr:hypothetical protein [Bacteroidota bacterium]
MKRKLTILMIASFLMAMGSITTYAQTKEEEEKKKQEQLILEKKLEAQEKAQEGRDRITIRRDELDKAVRKARDAYREQWRVAETPGIFTAGTTDLEGIYFMGGSQNSSSLQFSKVVKEASFTKELKFEIEENAKRASINVSGMCDEGEIQIVITMPSGKKYTEVLIDEYGSVNWSKSFSIDEENSTKAGEWGFKVTARDATGTFRLSLRSF